MSKKIIKRNEFRRHSDENNKKLKRKRGHPTYIYAQKGKNFIYVGITHSEITDGITNIPLEQNPNPKDEKKSYMVPKERISHKSSFGKKLKGWRLSENDKNKIPKKVKNAFPNN